MLTKYKDALNQMYAQYPKLKDKLTSVINHPLGPADFERAWNEMVQEFGLQERTTMQKLYDERRMWIAAYFKEIYCGTIQSTQRSESVNAMVKSGYLDNSLKIHEFAKRFLDILEHMRE